MTRDDIIRMAREAGLCTWTVPPDERAAEWAYFAALVAAAERAASAKLAEQMTARKRWAIMAANSLREIPPCAIAEAIRARGKP